MSCLPVWSLNTFGMKHSNVKPLEIYRCLGAFQTLWMESSCQLLEPYCCLQDCQSVTFPPCLSLTHPSSQAQYPLQTCFTNTERFLMNLEKPALKCSEVSTQRRAIQTVDTLILCYWLNVHCLIFISVMQSVLPFLRITNEFRFEWGFCPMI